MLRYQNAIKSIESSGGNYSLLGPVTKNGDRAYGAYQVMGNNIPEWTQRHLGRSMTPQEFLADQKAQDAVFNGQFGSYVQKYGNPEDAASAWFTGGPRSTGAHKRDILGTTGNVYVDKFSKHLADNPEDGVAAINSAAGIQPSGPGVLTSAFANEGKGALSADSTLGPGVLFNGSQEAPESRSTLDRVSNTLQGVGAGLASIMNPQQAAAITQNMAAQQRVAAPAQKINIEKVDPKTGMAIGTQGNRVIRFQAFAPQADDDAYAEKYKQESAKGMVELSTNINQFARDAAGHQQTVGDLRTALSNPDVYQGVGGEAVQSARKLFSALGYGDASAIADGDVANALGKKLALQLVQNGGTKLLPGSMSDGDRKAVELMSTSVSLNRDANMRLLDIYERQNQRTQQAEALRQKHEGENNGMLKPSFKGELANLSKQWMAEDKERERVEQAARKSPAAPSAAQPSKYGPGVRSITIVQP